MIRRKPTRNGKTVKVTFAIPEVGVDLEAVAVVGDFNDWDPSATPLKPVGKLRSASVTLPAGGRYAFRYLAEGGRWFNDHDADGYQRNDFGGDDCVLDLSQTG